MRAELVKRIRISSDAYDIDLLYMRSKGKLCGLRITEYSSITSIDMYGVLQCQAHQTFAKGYC